MELGDFVISGCVLCALGEPGGRMRPAGPRRTPMLDKK